MWLWPPLVGADHDKHSCLAWIDPGSRDAVPRRRCGLDEIALARLAERAVERGAAGVVVCGSTGEASALKSDEHARAVSAVVKAVGDRVPVIAEVGAPCTEMAAQLAQAAERCGARAVLCSALPYVKPEQEGLIAAQLAHVLAALTSIEDAHV